MKKWGPSHDAVYQVYREDGLSNQAIARRMRFSRYTVQKAAKRLGMLRQKRADPEEVARIRELLEKGNSCEGVAKMLGVSDFKVRYQRKRMGLPTLQGAEATGGEVV